MTTTWSLCLSLCVIVIFSNAAVLRSQTGHWTIEENVTEIATTIGFRSTTIDSKNVSSSTVSTIIDDRFRAPRNPSSSAISATVQSSQDGRIFATSPFTPLETTIHSSRTTQLAVSSIPPRRAPVTGRTAAITLPSTRSWTATRSYDLTSSLSVANVTQAKPYSLFVVSRASVNDPELTSPLGADDEYDRTTFASSANNGSRAQFSSTTSTTLRTTTTTTTTNASSELNATTYEVVTSTESSSRYRKPSTRPSTASSLPETTAATSYPNTNLLSVPVGEERRASLNKERSQFPGITLKVSHVLIPKQKRSGGYSNAQNLRIELPALRSPPKTGGKRSNCTRFPVQVVTAADTESNEKVNLTEEHYDCEFSSDVPSMQRKDPPIHTYYGGYVFRYTIPKVAVKNSTANRTWTESARTRETTTVAEVDDYDSSYVEYWGTSNSSAGNASGVVDDDIFPDPIFSSINSSSSSISSSGSGSKQVVIHVKPEAYNSPASDDSMLDNDLHDHDVIDSVMYIYFGGAPRGQKGAGRQIIIVGAVIALIAQFLTLASSLRRIKTHKREAPTVILLNVETALTLTNLIFILGVQSTSNHTQCGITAVVLYYLHLVILIWFWLSSVYCVQVVCQIKPASCELFKYCLCGWLLPLVITSLNYFFNQRSFETSSYCWISPLKGVLVSYILPVILLTLMCVALTVYGLKHGTEPLEDVDDTYSHRKLLRIVAVSLPIFSVTWFTGMVALENSASLLYSLIFLISDTVLNWLLFACWLPSEASQWKDMDEDYYDEDEDYEDEPVMVKRRFDDQPLLSELYEYGAQGQLYNMKVEPISIIHTP